MPNQPDRVILEGVPRVGYDVRFCTVAGCIESAMAFLKDPVDYDYVMGVSGLAFRRLWNRDDGGNVGPFHFAPECLRRVFWALGYDYRVHPGSRDRAVLLREIKKSLAAGRPVLAAGTVGPPECCLITGYSAGGDVLHGWSYFQDEPKSEPFARPDWYEKSEWATDAGIVVIRGKKPGPLPSKREVLARTLRLALEMARKRTWTGVKDHSNGLKAYDDWARATEVDADYPRDDAKVMETRHMVLMDQAVMVEERRHAAGFLRRMADEVPEAAPHLRAAAGLYDEVSKEAGPVYPWGPNWARPDLSDAAVRREIARHIRAAADAEKRAVAELALALKALG